MAYVSLCTGYQAVILPKKCHGDLHSPAVLNNCIFFYIHTSGFQETSLSLRNLLELNSFQLKTLYYCWQLKCQALFTLIYRYRDLFFLWKKKRYWWRRFGGNHFPGSLLNAVISNRFSVSKHSCPPPACGTRCWDAGLAPSACSWLWNESRLQLFWGPQSTPFETALKTDRFSPFSDVRLAVRKFSLGGIVFGLSKTWGHLNVRNHNGEVSTAFTH